MGQEKPLQTNKDECGSPPTLPGQHQLTLVITIMYLNQWQQYVARKVITRPQLGSTIAGVLEKPQQNFRQDKIDSADSLFQSCLESKQRSSHDDAATDLVLVTSIFSIYALLSAIVPA